MGGATGSRERAPDDRLRDTHHVSATGLMGIASLHPSRALVVQRCFLQIARASKPSCCHHV